MNAPLNALLEFAAVRACRRLEPAGDLPSAPRIFVLRNNDLGDVLVITPLFEALRRLFPAAHLAVGVGRWAFPLLEGNPHVDEVLEVPAPWFNKYTTGGALRGLRFIAGPQPRRLRDLRFDLGIDVLGSTLGSLLLLKAGIPYRLGRTGFAGGDRSASRTIAHSITESVGRNALRFAEVLGGRDIPSLRPQLFLTASEFEYGRSFWSESGKTAGKRWLISPGAGRADKSWPEERFLALTRELAGAQSADVAVVTGPMETALAGRLQQSEPRARMAPTGCSIRELAGIVAAADRVVCNSSLVLHLAAAFERPTVVVLGPSFASAREHQAVWGHPLSISLGAERGERSGVASVAKVVESFHELKSISA